MSFVAWVVAREDDPSLAPLAALHDRVDFVIGDDTSRFAQAPRPDVIMFATGTTALFEAIWRLAGDVRWVHSRFAGVEHVLFPALVQSEVTLTSGRGAFAPALAEFTIGALLYFEKDFPRLVASQRRGVWEPYQPGELRGRTLGIVGYGEIGRATAQLAAAMGMDVIAARRHPDRSRNDVLVREMFATENLRTMIAHADHVLVATPLTPETRALVGAGELAAMREHGVLVNVGRGPVVDERALLSALARNAIRGAALDVFEVEPLPSGHTFYGDARVLLSPHCADRVPGWLERATDVFVQNVQHMIAGERLVNVVDKRLGY